MPSDVKSGEQEIQLFSEIFFEKKVGKSKSHLVYGPALRTQCYK